MAGDVQFLEMRAQSGGRSIPISEGESVMKYGLAWLLGIPPVLIAGWFLLNHC